MNNIHYAFLSRLIPEQMYEQTLRLSRKNMQDAANALQWHLYNGLSKNLNCEITLLNVLPVHSWPQYYARAWVKGSRFDADYSKNNQNIGFCNIKGVRKASQQRNTYAALRNWCRTHEGKQVLFVYTLSATAMEAIRRVKREFPRLTVCCIIADLPDMSSLQKKSMLTALADRQKANTAYAGLKYVDCFALLTKHMADYMGIDRPWCVVEGIATPPEEIQNIPARSEAYKTILYAGTLHGRFGILELLEAFRGIAGEDYRLLISGNGDSTEAVRQAAKQDDRITYLGQLPRKDVLALQKTVDVLVNPRPGNEEFTKYSFPSKNMEALSSGTPLVACRLPGIPEEYEPYIFYADKGVEALREKLVQVCRMPAEERADHGRRAQEFVLTQKNDVVQTKKIIEMVDALLK